MTKCKKCGNICCDCALHALQKALSEARKIEPEARQIELPRPIFVKTFEPPIGPGTRSVDEYYRHIRPMNDRERVLVDQVMNAHALWPQRIRMGG